MARIAYITNAGLSILANRLKGVGNEPVYFAWGTGAGNASPTSTQLFTEASEARPVMVSQIVTVTAVGDGYQLTGAIVADANKTITNWGVFDAASGGNLLIHESSNPGEAYTLGQIGAFLFRLQFIRGT
jgi:hypothetical protein